MKLAKAGTNDIEIRTPHKNLLVCTIASCDDGSIEIVSRHGKQEDRMRMEAFLESIFRR